MYKASDLYGKRTKHGIYNKFGALLVPADSVLNTSDVIKMINHKVDLDTIVLVTERKTRPIPTELQLINDITVQSEIIFQSVRQSGSIPLANIQKNLIPRIKDAANSTNLYQIFDSLKAKNDYTYRHNIAVGVLAVLIGNWIKLSEDDLNELAIAATLFDVGKMMIQSEIINKRGRLSNEEFETMKSHTIRGYEIIKNTVGLSHKLALTALQHHERENGNGYPFGLQADKIDLFAKITAIADMFHALSSDRVFQRATSTYKIVEIMQAEMETGRFNTKIISIFLQKMMDSMIGNIAILSDNRECIIVRINPYEPMSPLVQIEDQFIDLSKDKSVYMRDITS